MEPTSRGLLVPTVTQAPLKPFIKTSSRGRNSYCQFEIGGAHLRRAKTLPARDTWDSIRFATFDDSTLEEDLSFDQRIGIEQSE
jgi:hypothetical protein